MYKPPTRTPGQYAQLLRRLREEGTLAEYREVFLRACQAEQALENYALRASLFKRWAAAIGRPRQRRRGELGGCVPPRRRTGTEG